MKKVLITGATGFVGKHLTDYLSTKVNTEIFGTSLSDSEKNDTIQIERVDLTNFDEVGKLIDKIKPDFVYHLAALTSPAESFKNPTPVVLGNIEIQLNVLNSIKNAELKNTRILVVSSSEVYGMIGEKDLPIDENTAMRPVSPYAVSKVTQDFLARQYSMSYDMDIVTVRPFNHTGPGQAPAFVTPAFAKQIAEIENGKKEPVLNVGNLKAERDFTDVRDVVRAYDLLMEKGEKGGSYNVGSGKPISIQSILDMLLSYSKEEITVKQDPARLLPIEIPKVYCDYSKLKNLTGWTPETSIETTLKDTLDYWRSIV